MPKTIPLVSLISLLIGGACSGSDILPSPIEQPPERVPLLAVADVASCESTSDDATSIIADTVAGDIIMAGDIAYESGTTAEFNNCFAPAWGRHRARIHPAPGNHEYESSTTAAPYFAYF
ncbi:MAG TPA: hypothetical protein VM099_02480, partial [Gemmatimonadaceae bacterium]|nr:hypothetical protein [Gemmatimonadaceae bacterium]